MSDSNRNGLSRREFMKAVTMWTGGLIAALVGIPSVAYLVGPALESREDNAVIDLGELEAYPIGIPTRFDFTRTKVNGWERTSLNYGMFVVRTNDRDVRVFSDICTHLGCRVSWHPNLQHYVSPCHDGHFDIMGRNISGPPPRPLDEFITKIGASKLLVQLPPIKRSA
jgi:Rieske Fe-S protein